MTRTKMVSPIDADLLSRVENLSDTAGYLTTLIDIIERDVLELRASAEKGIVERVSTFAVLGDWDEILSLLRLLWTQVDIVDDVSKAVSAARLPVQI